MSHPYNSPPNHKPYLMRTLNITERDTPSDSAVMIEAVAKAPPEKFLDSLATTHACSSPTNAAHMCIWWLIANHQPTADPGYRYTVAVDTVKREVTITFERPEGFYQQVCFGNLFRSVAPQILTMLHDHIGITVPSSTS